MQQEENVQGRLQMDGLGITEESSSREAQDPHEMRADEREERLKLSEKLGKYEQDEAEKNSGCIKKAAAQRCSDNGVMADTGKCLGLPITSEELKERQEVAKGHAPLLEGKTNGSKDLREQQSQEKREKLSLKTPASSGRRHILLVEDNVINQRVVQRKLFDRNYRISIANNGREAVEFVTAAFRKESEQQGEAIDMVLMDLEMPVMNGNAATAQIREIEREKRREARVPILGISANVRQEKLQEMLDHGMNGYITKPYSFEDMVNRIREMLSEDGGG
jgi:CheY-like chemotaxis protein